MDHQPSGSPKVAPIESFDAAVTEKKNYAELVKKVILFGTPLIGNANELQF